MTRTKSQLTMLVLFMLILPSCGTTDEPTDIDATVEAGVAATLASGESVTPDPNGQAEAYQNSATEANEVADKPQASDSESTPDLSCPEGLRIRLESGDYSELVPGATLAYCDFSQLNLSDLDLADAILTGANLSFADLTRTNLAGANLTEANLFGANLTEAILARATMINADLRWASLFDTNMSATDVLGALLHPNASLVAAPTGSDTGPNGGLWDLEESRFLGAIRIYHTGGRFGFGWSPRGDRFVAQGHIYGVNVGDENFQVTDHATTVNCHGASWHPDGDIVVAGGVGLETSTWEELFQIRAWSGALRPDGQYYAASSREVTDSTIIFYDMAGAETDIILQGHSAAVRVLAWSSDGRRLISGSDDATSRIWDPFIGENIAILRHNDPVHAVGLNRDGTMAATLVVEGYSPMSNQSPQSSEVRIWDTETGTPIETILDDNVVTAIAWHPSRQLLALGGPRGTIWLWDATTGSVTELFSQTNAFLDANNDLFSRFWTPFRCLAWGPNGDQLAGLDTSQVVIWPMISLLSDW